MEVDEFIVLVMEYSEKMESLAAEKIKELFEAVDFQDNEYLSLEEFVICYRCVVLNSKGKEYGEMVYQEYMEKDYDYENKSIKFKMSYE